MDGEHSLIWFVTRTDEIIKFSRKVSIGFSSCKLSVNRYHTHTHTHMWAKTILLETKFNLKQFLIHFSFIISVPTLIFLINVPRRVFITFGATLFSYAVHSYLEVWVYWLNFQSCHWIFMVTHQRFQQLTLTRQENELATLYIDYSVSV